MKTAYVLLLVMLATVTIVFGVGALVFEGNSMLLVQGVFNAMVALGALLSYRES